MKKGLFVSTMVSLLFLCLMFTGCGGGGSKGPDVPTPPISGTASLSSSSSMLDGHAYNAVTFKANINGYIYLRMEAAGDNPMYDPYVRIYQGDDMNGTYLGWYDDDESSRNVHVKFLATKDQHYTILFTSATAGDYGTYAYGILDNSGGAAAAGTTSMLQHGSEPNDKQKN